MRSMLVVPLLALLGVIACAEGHAAESASDALDGKELFRSTCGVCHLAGGTGTFMLGRRLGQNNALLETRTNLTPEYIEQVVRNGIVSMPRISRGELSDAELQAVASYLTRAGRGAKE